MIRVTLLYGMEDHLSPESRGYFLGCAYDIYCQSVVMVYGSHGFEGAESDDRSADDEGFDDVMVPESTSRVGSLSIEPVQIPDLSRLRISGPALPSDAQDEGDRMVIDD